MKKLTKAERKMLMCIGKRWTGKPSYIKVKKARALTIARAIDARFHVHVYQYQLKHIKWYVEFILARKVRGTITNYRPVIFAIIELLDKSYDWQPCIEKSINQVLANN